MDIKGIAEAYASMYEAKKKDDEKTKKGMMMMVTV